MRRRAASSFVTLPAAIALVDQVLLFDNSGPVHRQLLGIEDRRILLQTKDLPRWLRDLLPRIADALVSQQPL